MALELILAIGIASQRPGSKYSNWFEYSNQKTAAAFFESNRIEFKYSNRFDSQCYALLPGPQMPLREALLAVREGPQKPVEYRCAMPCQSHPSSTQIKMNTKHLQGFLSAQSAALAQKPDALPLGKLGLHPFQKIGSALRMLAYREAADVNNEYFQLAGITEIVLYINH
ncbi:hypothetical protein PSTG_11778 [Puccinia striiformis f. sp. tritici PST-78]|uniref:Uncharacterized protein n=1 Tax=Puccinia striiformis f. sp. tritici PST-78 TaxID=1165861 RepID=A0A0L0V7A1_9BASI|nr:hypothetical protein PSTG_11778 [Puccinia striiformis f. sp. tritici PST-78]